MDRLEREFHGFNFKIEEPRIVDGLKVVFITEYSNQRLVVQTKCEITESQDEKFALV